MAMKDKLKSGVQKCAVGLVVLMGLFIGLKGCVVTVWSSPKALESYEITGVNGRSMHMVFMPKNETIISYTDPNEESIEILRTKMKGTYGTHYIGPIWKIGGPANWLGLRWYSSGEPVEMEIRVLKKYRIGSGDSAFPNEGKSSVTTMLFADDAVYFNEMWFQKIDNDIELIQSLQSAVPSETH